MKKYFIFLLLPVFINVSCVATKHLPKPNEFKDYVYGLHIEGTIMVRSGEISKAYDLAGEIIAVHDDAIFIRVKTNEIIRYEKNTLVNGNIMVAKTSNNPVGIAIWAGLINLIPASHGAYMLISVPINLGVTIPIAVSANKTAYLMNYPKEISWDQMRKFARFPQGLPPGF